VRFVFKPSYHPSGGIFSGDKGGQSLHLPTLTVTWSSDFVTEQAGVEVTITPFDFQLWACCRGFPSFSLVVPSS